MKKVYLILITGLIFLLGWMPANGQTYCTTGLYSTGCGPFGEDINSFIFGDYQDLNTGCTPGDYANKTGDTIVIYQGLTYDISVNSNYPSTVFFAVWIDFNSDGDFDDPGEMIWASQVANSGVNVFVNGSVEIPFTAPLGVKRLRVRSKWGSPPFTSGQSCASFTWGETHDYSILVLPAPPCIPPSLSGVSNLTNSTADVNFAGGPDIVAYNIEWGPAGFTAGTGSVSLATTSPYTITGLTQNTTYDVYIQGICQDTLSPLVGPVSFTTLPDNLLVFSYSGGDIPTTDESPALTTNISPCAGVMTVNLPNDLWITSVDVYYNMTAQAGAFMSEQRSRLWSPTSNTGEDEYFMGTGTGGTFSYARTGLNQFNMMFGEVEFMLDAKRTWPVGTNPGCNTIYNYVDSNSWELHITLDTMPDCIFPFNVQVSTLDTSALITWMDNPTAVAFNWEYGPAGYTQGTGSLASGITVADSVILNGLSPETAYDFYVQSICGPDGNSVWIGPVSFETKCSFLAAGTYTLGDATSDFLDFIELVDYLQCGGLGGPVIINVVPGVDTFDQRVVFPAINGSSATNTLTINGNNTVLQYNPTVTDARSTLELNGATYITFNDMKILSYGSTSWGWAAHLRNNADYNTFNNCTFEIDLAMTGTGFSAFVVGSSLTSATVAGHAANNLTITDSEFIGGYYCLVLNGPTGAPFSQNYHIENNIIRDFHFYGIYMRGQENAVIDRNDIYRDQRTNITTFYGIYSISGMPGTMITNNRIHSPYGNITPPGTALAYGTFITGSPGTETSPWYFINNQIYNMNTNGTVYGIYTTGTTDHFRVYHNSISIVNTTSGGFGAVRAGWFASGSLNAEVMNNIFHVNSTNTGAKYAVYVNSPAGYEIDHNVLSNVSPVGNSFIGNIAFGDIGTFEAWQDAGFDENGINVNPIFVDEMVDLMPQIGAIKGIGADLTAVAPLDFDGIVRPTDPDPGVYQFEVDSCAAPFVVNITPGDTFAIISWVPNVPTALWQIEYGPAGYTVGTGMFATTTETNFTINGLLPETAYDVYIRPDCGADSQWGDAESFSTLCLFLLEGTYTLGNATADFANFTALVDYFNCGGIAGPVVIQVIPNSGPFNEQIIFPHIPGSSMVNTITIMGNDNTLEYLSTNTNERATLKLNGTKHMTIKHLNIVALGTTTAQFGYGVQLMNNADYNTFDSCTIEVTDLLTSLNYAGFVASNSATSATVAGNPASHLTVTNCEIIGGYYGLTISGPTTAPWLQNNVITNNVVRDFYLYGVYWRGNANSLIDGNDINRATRQGPISTFYGIFSLNGLDSTFITNNRIHNSLGIKTSSTSGQYGLYFSNASGSVDNPYYVYNNMIYNLRTTGFSGGIYMFNPNHFRLYHNSISLSNNQTTGSGTFYGLYISGAAMNSEVKNNIINMDLAFGGSRYLMYFASALNETESDYNVFYQASNTGTLYFGNYGGFGSDILTFADWQALGLDSNSVYSDPIFVNSVTNLVPQALSVSQIGIDLTDIVPFDINGVERSETPDPGAIEFEPADCLSPTGVTFSNILQNSASMTWTDNSTTGQWWEIEMDTLDFTPSGVPTDTATIQPFDFSGLSPLTTYQVYIRVYCGDNLYSAWSGPYNFTTACAEFSLPFFEGFDGLSVQCWTYPQGQGNWAIGASYTPAGATAPNAFFNWSPSITNYSHSLTSPLLDGTDASNPVIIDYKLLLNYFSNVDPNYMISEFKTTADTVWTVIDSINSADHPGINTWTIVDHVLPGVSGNLFQVRFRAAGVNSFQINGWGLDDVFIREIPDCPEIQSLTIDSVAADAALISWVEIGNALQWDIEYDTAGFDPTGIPTVAGISNPYLITGLDESTSYEFYIRGDCDTLGYSFWSGPFNFTTECIPASIFGVGAEICAGDSALLFASSDNTDATFAWYAMAEGGSSLGEGELFNTGPLAETTTFYVSSVIGDAPESAGKPNYTFTDNTNGSLWGLVFDVVDNDIVLESVDVFSVAAGGGSITVQLQNSAGAVIANAGPFTIPTGSVASPTQHTLELGLEIPVGTGYRLLSTNMSGNLIREFTGITYPYVSPSGNVAVTSGFIGSPGSATYYWFYNWQVGAGCLSPRFPVTVDVSAGPEFDLGGDAILCEGDELELSGPGGFTNYEWTITTASGTTTSPAQTVIADESGTYTLTVTNNEGCSATDQVTITVVPALEFEVSASATEVCEGESVTLTATGAGLLFSWSGDVENGVAFTPTETSTYILTVTDSLGSCLIEDEVTITVTAFPTVTATASATTVCSGDMVTLSGSGADSYEWSGGVEDGVPFVISETTTFTVTGTTNGCSDNDEITITVNPTPDVTLELTLSDTLCVEDGVVELSGGSPAGGVWSGAGVSGTSFDPAVAGEGFQTISYTVTDGSGCSATATAEVYVDICISTKDLLLTDVSVYPNPFNQYIDIRWLQLPTNTAEIRVIDILGRTLSFHKLEDNAVNSGQYRVELEQLAAGSYIIELRSGEATFRQTILKAQ